MRIGFGFDVHPFVSGRPLVLGGITIPFDKGLAGHSDADVLVHAIMDAMLGAAGLRDIGEHYPDHDSRYREMDSKRMLADTMAKIREAGYWVGNIDCTLCLQRPKIASYIGDMQEILCQVMEIEKEALSIKATTTEHLGFVGREEGAAAWAVALLRSSAP